LSEEDEVDVEVAFVDVLLFLLFVPLAEAVVFPDALAVLFEFADEPDGAGVAEACDAADDGATLLLAAVVDGSSARDSRCCRRCTATSEEGAPATRADAMRTTRTARTKERTMAG
jgi:hypothetical protein